MSEAYKNATWQLPSVVELELLVGIFAAFASVVFVAMLLFDISPYIRRKDTAYKSVNYNPKVLVIVPCRYMLWRGRRCRPS